MILGGFTNTNPADGTNYYVSSFFGTALSATTAWYTRPLKTFLATKVFLMVNISGTGGSSENVTIKLYKNGVETTLGTQQWNSSIVTSTFNISESMVAGVTEVAIKFECPTWVTNPTISRGYFIIY